MGVLQSIEALTPLEREKRQKNKAELRDKELELQSRFLELVDQGKISADQMEAVSDSSSLNKN